MSITTQLTLVARYDKEDKLWRATVKRGYGEPDFDACVGEGTSPDEARGHLLREMILVGLEHEPVFLDIETEES